MKVFHCVPHLLDTNSTGMFDRLPDRLIHFEYGPIGIRTGSYVIRFENY
jgi:hypothetical protein